MKSSCGGYHDGRRRASSLLTLSPYTTFHLWTFRQLKRCPGIRRPFPTRPLSSRRSGPYVTAYVDEHGSGITREGVDGAVPYVVWVNVGIANFTKVLAHHFAWTLVRKHGGLSQLFDAAASTQNKAILIELLRERRFKEDPEISKALRDAPYPARPTDRVSWLAPRFGNIHDLDKDILAVVAMFGRVQTTFIIGHEMGHLYLGHLGSHPRTQLLRSSSPLPFSDLFASEIEADMIGMLSIWDGYTNATEGGSASIDHTWVVPLFFLATMLGFAQATSEEENAEKWWYRLYFLCRSLKGSLREADFECRGCNELLMLPRPSPGPQRSGLD